jgi:RimJ/RimL family protein N-acetyltransferase
MIVLCASQKSNPTLNEALGAFVANRIFGKANDWGPYGTLGVAKGDQIVAGVVFHNWHKDCGVIEISAASDSRLWLTRPVLLKIFSIAFLQHACQTVVARVDPDNHVRRIFKAYGFREMVLPRMRGRDKDEILLTLTDDDWLKNGFHKDYSHG